MLRNLLLLLSIVLLANRVSGQERINPVEPFYVNVFIAADKTVYVERSKTSFKEIESKVAEIVHKKPFILDQKIVYRIFGDENLMLGYVMDVNREMLAGYGENVQTLKYLLNTTLLNIDGQNWFKSMDIKKLEDKR